jgi:hypothetical protein
MTRHTWLLVIWYTWVIVLLSAMIFIALASGTKAASVGGLFHCRNRILWPLKTRRMLSQK